MGWPPSYDGVLIEVAVDPEGRRVVVVGIGNDGDRPAAITLVCPWDGIDGLIADLECAAEQARPHHRRHA